MNTLVDWWGFLFSSIFSNNLIKWIHLQVKIFMNSKHFPWNQVIILMITLKIFILMNVRFVLIFGHIWFGFLLEHSSSSSSSNHIRDSGYETTSSHLDQQQQQRFQRAISPSNVSLSPDGHLITVTYFSSPIPLPPDSSLSTSTTIPRTLKTFSQMPVTHPSGNELSPAMNTHLAEQEIIEVW